MNIHEQLFANTSDNHFVEFGLKQKLDSFKLNFTMNPLKKIKKLEKRIKLKTEFGSGNPSSYLTRIADKDKVPTDSKTVLKEATLLLTTTEEFFDIWEEHIKEGLKVCSKYSGKVENIPRLTDTTKTFGVLKNLENKGNISFIPKEFKVIGGDYKPRLILDVGSAGWGNLDTPEIFSHNVEDSELITVYTKLVRLADRINSTYSKDGTEFYLNLLPVYRDKNKDVRVLVDDYWIPTCLPSVKFFTYFFKQVIAIGKIIDHQ